MDVVRVLTEPTNATAARKYWNKLKERLKTEGGQLVTDCHQLRLPAADGSELVTKCHQLKLTAEDGKQRLTDVATAETLLRLVQSVPSPKAEPIKLRLARVGHERMEEIADPGLSLERTRESWRKLGRSEKWITQRMTGQETRHKLTDGWATHEVQQGACGGRQGQGGEEGRTQTGSRGEEDCRGATPERPPVHRGADIRLRIFRHSPSPPAHPTGPPCASIPTSVPARETPQPRSL